MNIAAPFSIRFIFVWFGALATARGQIAARWKHEGSSEPTGEQMSAGGRVELESGIPYETARALIQRGHDVRGGTATGGFGGYQAIRWDDTNRVYIGASDGRKDGQAVGY